MLFWVKSFISRPFVCIFINLITGILIHYLIASYIEIDARDEYRITEHKQPWMVVVDRAVRAVVEILEEETGN